MGDPRYRLNVDFDNTIIPFLYNTTGEWTFTVPASPNFMGSRYVVFLPAVMVLNEVDKIPAISGYSRIEGGIPLTSEFRTIAAADYNTLLLKDAIEFPADSAGDTLTMTNFYTVGSTVEILSGTPIVDITDDTTLATNTIYILNASAIKTLTLPATALKGDTIKIIDKGGKLFNLKRSNNLTDSLLSKSKKLVTSNFNEYFKSVSLYSVADLICTVDNTEWQEQNLSDLENKLGKGFVLGGILSSTTVTAVIEDVNFSDETSVPISATLNTARGGACAGLNTLLKGYVGGGTSSDEATYYTAIEDLVFSTETSGAISGALNTAKCYCAGVFTVLKGYFMGGQITASASTNVIEDLTFSTEESVPIAATLNANRSGGASFSAELKGYVMGGTNGTRILTYQSSIFSLIFETETDETISATMSGIRGILAGLNSSLKGFSAGGSTLYAGIEYLTFSTESSGVLSATLNTSKMGATGVSAVSKGFICGGYSGVFTNPYSAIEDLNFTAETSDVLTATLNTAKFLMGDHGVSGIA